MMNDLQRFIDRIGKRIYRDVTTCTCNDCEKVAKEGLIVNDETHAYHLHSMSGDYPIEYRDNP